MRNSYNGGKWTPAKFKAWVIGILRRAMVRWEPKRDALDEACVGQKVNKRTGRLAKHYCCADCGGVFVLRDVQVDHIEPVVDPEVGFVDWETFVDRMFCETDNLQVLCKPCHKDKTKAEGKVRKENR